MAAAIARRRMLVRFIVVVVIGSVLTVGLIFQMVHKKPAMVSARKDVQGKRDVNQEKIREAMDLVVSSGLTVKMGARKTMKLSDVKSTRRSIIIVAQPRSGSSFLGEAFNQHPDVFYLFEPLHGVGQRTTQNTSKDSALNFLRSIFRCEFRFPSYLKDIEKFRRFSSRALSSPPLCTKQVDYTTMKKEKPNCLPLKAENLESVCKLNYSSTVVKVLTSRIPQNRVDSLFPLCNSSRYDCMIIHLVRDPRPLIFSHMKVGMAWNNMFRSSGNTPFPAVKTYSTRICRQMEENLKALENLPAWMKGRYKLLRYEDLASHPTDTLKNIYHAAGIPMSDNVVQWIEQSTGEEKHSRQEERNEFSTKRNSKTLINRWRLEVDHCLVNIVEQSCQSVMKRLGYKPVNESQDTQFDLNVSLLAQAKPMHRAHVT